MRGIQHRRLLIALTSFVGGTALLGGAGLILNPDGQAVGMPPGILDDTPFRTYLVPGLLLFLVVGGSSVLAAAALVRRFAWAPAAAFGSGAILFGWIVVQMAMIGGPHWLQVTYLLLGASIMALAGRAELTQTTYVMKKKRNQVQFSSIEKGPRLYRDLADWYPLLTPVSDYAEEATFYRRSFETHCQRKPRSLLDLGSGGGHNAAHLKATLDCTLVDLAPAMLDISRRLNPECEHVQGDMRTVRLGRFFDCVLVHDAVSYMTSRADLASVIATAFEHTAPDGVAIFQPDFVTETFEPGTDSGGSDAGGRGLRYLEWRWVPEAARETYVTDMSYLLRDESGAVEALHDRHVMGLFPRAVWLELIAAAGFEPLAVPFVHSMYVETGHEVFLGLRLNQSEGARDK